MSTYLSMTELAQKLNMERSSARKFMIKHGFTPERVRTIDSKNQLTLALPEEEAERLLELRQSLGFTASPTAVPKSKGFFYAIQLIPEYNPNRIKLGFATNVNARLSSHRTSAPTATLLKTWACELLWEPVAIASITRIECTHITDEVYECINIDNLIQRTDAFFAIMPSHSAQRPADPCPAIPPLL